MASINSLMLRTETTPVWRNAASMTSAAPASDPEWVAAARCETSDLPPFKNNQRLVSCGGFARDRQQLCGCLNPSTKPAITRVFSSSTK